MDKLPGLVNIGFSKAVEVAINTAIRLDEQHGMAFDDLDSTVIEINITPFNESLFCLINGRNIAVQHALQGEADSCIKTDITELINLPMSHNLQAQVTAGDETLAENFIQALNQLEIDWEEHLSHYTGDLLAFKIGHGFRSAMQRKQDAKSYMGETIKEYLQFEINSLPARHQVEHFIEDVAQVKQGVDNLAERIAALTTKTN